MMHFNSFEEMCDFALRKTKVEVLKKYEEPTDTEEPTEEPKKPSPKKKKKKKEE